MSASEGLTREQVQQFHEQGYLGPFDLFSESEAKERKVRIREEMNSSDEEAGFDDLHPHQLRHLDSPAICDVCTQEKIVTQMADIYGDDLLLWDSKLFYKRPGRPEIPWHQHYHHMPIEPKISITAWVALSDCTEENGCLELIPGSNERPYPEVESRDGVKNPKTTDPEYVDDEKAVRMEMDAGQYLLFSETTLHRSSANTSDNCRRALAVRATPPHVKIKWGGAEDNSYRDNHPAMLLSGEDEYQINQLTRPPEGASQRER